MTWSELGTAQPQLADIVVEIVVIAVVLVDIVLLIVAEMSLTCAEIEALKSYDCVRTSTL